MSKGTEQNKERTKRKEKYYEKERIMITHMETVGEFTRIFAYTMADGLGFVQDCLGDSKDAIKMTRTAFVIAKGSVMHV